jgi:hypothetical protein
MMPPFHRRDRSDHLRSTRARLQLAVAWFALVSLVFPSLGALPWICADIAFGGVAERDPHPVLARGGHAAAHEHAGHLDHAGHHDHDPSDIPGSPFHPLDHDCSPCQVLATLARCAILPPSIPVVAVIPPRPLRPLPIVAPRVTVLAAVLPPVRAPPPVNA